ncbi:MAG: GNAT family N-acetyltransferase [Sphingobacteriales bacterium]|jgi:ribosomal protein S18 acetylase RimI-like enzyme|nr:GNAT family N-acetyltransferase [Sphingobacteriales bacterium]MCC7057437.1 GNAT family N-acetyltransferase [Chitinophagales bacterium]MBK6890805.1 GNAT family N-acetyltransferase [Sphingobacteriales bacterium]MBK7526141.1 GNAT family N-acetyltransferase [Sphingobacteriales bacterium]MBK8677856.1 GNAT family N-acetyltransferase [Sphingobacteriales bacterium]
MLIRKAKVEDSNIIAAYILLAMNDIIYHFIGENSSVKAVNFLNCLIQEKGNQYSYENCWIAETENEIVAAAIVYDGAKLKELRKPVANTIKAMFNRDFAPEDETQSGEYYIDCIGVNPNQQGKGIGTKILQFLIHEYVNQRDKTLGLLVDKNNPKAKQLYLKIGFEIVDEVIFVGKVMEHLQMRNKKPRN